MEEELKQLKAKVEELTAKLSASEGRCEKMSALCLKRLGKSFDDWAKEESTEHEEAKAQLTALSAFQSKALELSGKADPAEALGMIALAVTQAKELVTLKQKIADDAAKALDTEFNTTLDAAVAAGKLPPAGVVSKEFFVGLKADFGTEKALAALKKAIPAEPIVTLSANAPHEPAPVAAVAGVEMEIASQMGGRFGGTTQFKALREADLKARTGTPTA